MARGKKIAKCKFCAKISTTNPFGGTRHLKTHGENCARKYLGGKDPMQSQLQFQEDGSVSTWTYDPTVARESLGRLIDAMDLPINFGYNSFYKDHIAHSLKKVIEQPPEMILLLIITKFTLH